MPATATHRPCPSCGDKDDFYFHYTAEHPHWRCRECGFTQEPTGEELQNGGAVEREPLTAEQQAHAAAAYAEVARYCADKLWTDEGAQALDYLRQRGFSDETLRAAGIGWHHDDRRNGVALDLWKTNSYQSADEITK
jgi:rubredoxin